MDKFMRAALEEAKLGLEEGGIPIGAILVKGGKVIGKGHNRRVQRSDPIMHAEIDCLRDAGRIRTYDGTTLYSTLMPCYLCAGAVVQFGIKKVIAGESRSFSGAREFMTFHSIEVVDLDDAECIEMMRKFILKNPELWDEDIGAL
jgi:creatinine deaminase